MSIQIDGYLKKKNAKTSILLRNWNKRWFSLAGDTLSYSKTPREKAPSGTYSCADILSVSKLNDNEFEVTFPERILTLRADDAVEVRRWLEALQTARRSYAGGSAPYSDSQAHLQDEVPPQRPSPLEAEQPVGDNRKAKGDNSIPSPRSLLANPGAMRRMNEQGQGQTSHQSKSEAPPSPRTLLSRPQANGHAFGMFFSGEEEEQPNSDQQTAPEERVETDILAFNGQDDSQPSTPARGKSRDQSREPAKPSWHSQIPVDPIDPPAPRPGFGGNKMDSPDGDSPVLPPDSETEVAPVNIGADENFVDDDWDDDSDSEAEDEGPVERNELLESFDDWGKGAPRPIAPPKQEPSKLGRGAVTAKKAVKDRPKLAETDWAKGDMDTVGDWDDDVASPNSTSEVRPITPVAASRASSAGVRQPPASAEDENPKPGKPATAGVATDENWLEEDWDSD